MSMTHYPDGEPAIMRKPHPREIAGGDAAAMPFPLRYVMAAFLAGIICAAVVARLFF